MASTGDQFALDVSKFAIKAKGNMDAVVRKIVLDVGTRIVMRSPVGDPSRWAHTAPKGYIGGHFRANWQYSEGAFPNGVLPVIDKSGNVSLQRIRLGLAAVKKAYGTIHFIGNNLPYGPRLENGWSKQAPYGMVALTVKEFQGIVKQALKGLP